MPGQLSGSGSGSDSTFPIDTGSARENGKAYGGVSPHSHAGIFWEARATEESCGPGRFPGFVYHAGNVLSMPHVMTSYWGALWSGVAHQARAERLELFLTDLVQSPWMNVLHQYKIGVGQFLGQSFAMDVSVVLTDMDVRKILQAEILPKTISPLSNVSDIVWLIYLDEHTRVCDGDLKTCDPHSDFAFGYHSFFFTDSGYPCTYAVIPALSDICVRQTCTKDASCSLRLSQTQEQRQTLATSHLFAEMVTNPRFDGWFDSDPAIGENGDICNGAAATFAAGKNIWTVQYLYSKQDDIQSDGMVFCASEAPVPLPSLL